MDWHEEPATQQQLLRLQQYGFVPTFNLTVTQAARLIRQYSKRPPQSGGQPAGPTLNPVRQHRPEQTTPPAPPLRAENLEESARLHAYRLHCAVEAAQRALRENPARLGVRADVNAAISARQRFWLDTCREGQDLQAASRQAIQFYQYYGARFFTPTWDQVGEVLEALDRAMPGWDRDHPELYYDTLRLNFPSLLRHR